MSFRLGATCCDFICMDDVLPSLPEGGDGDPRESSLGVRLAAAILTALMAFVLLLFLVHRLRQRRITGQFSSHSYHSCCTCSWCRCSGSAGLPISDHPTHGIRAAPVPGAHSCSAELPVSPHRTYAIRAAPVPGAQAQAAQSYRSVIMSKLKFCYNVGLIS